MGPGMFNNLGRDLAIFATVSAAVIGTGAYFLGEADLFNDDPVQVQLTDAQKRNLGEEDRKLLETRLSETANTFFQEIGLECTTKKVPAYNLLSDGSVCTRKNAPVAPK